MDHEWSHDGGAGLTAGAPGSTAGGGTVGAHSRSEWLHFRGANFPVYKARMRAKLQAAGLLYVLDGGEASASATAAAAGGSGDGGDAASTLPPQVKSSSSRKAAGAVGAAGQDSQSSRSDGRVEQDRQRVYGQLILTLDDAHVAIVTSEVAEGDAAGVWRMLLRMYERETVASKHQLRRELHRVKLGSTESIEAYKARVMHIVGRLRAMKEMVSEGETSYCLLEGLPKEYDVVRQSLEVQEVLTVEQLCSHLREAQERLRLRHRESKLAAMQMEQQLNAMGMNDRSRYSRAGGGDAGSTSVCGLCRQAGHWIGACPRRKGRASGECFVCGSVGHGWRDCQGSESATTASPSSGSGSSSSGKGGGRGRPPGINALEELRMWQERKYSDSVDSGGWRPPAGGMIE